MIDLIKINSVANDIYSGLRDKAGKVVEVVGLLLGFIVVAVVEVSFDDHACVNDYLKNGFFLALYFLLVSISLGLTVCLDNNAFYSTNNKELSSGEEENLVKHLNKLGTLLNFSIFFCVLGLFSVLGIVILLVSNSLYLAEIFVVSCFVTLLIIVYFILPSLIS